LTEVETHLLDYDRLLSHYYLNIEREVPKQGNVRSISHWLNGNKPLAAKESTFLDDWDDLISPKPRADHGGLDSLLGNFTAALGRFGLAKLFTTQDVVDKSDDRHVILFASARVITATRFLTTFLAATIMTVPIIVLYNVEKMSYRLWIITVFTGLFSSVLCLFTQSRNSEIFSATAAYCAIMVVFVGNLP